VNSDIYHALGLTDEEYDSVCTLLSREPNFVETAMFSVMWSEHCSYKSSRIHLSRLPSAGEQVILGPGENAGVVRVDDKWALAIRMESHNHPSAIEPTQGAATGVGGILRDIFAVGARPIALLDSLWVGPEDNPRSCWLLEGIVNGISSYGNAVGVPTVGGEIHRDPQFSDNPLVNVVAVGVVEEDKIVRARASGVGNAVVLVGARTGRDGIGGVSVLASADLDESSSTKRPAVQVGDPFEEKKLIEASLCLIDQGLVVGVQDLGGAGITCATSETAANAGTGMHVWLNQVPLREQGMTPAEILTSESQERMLFVVEPNKVASVLAVCESFEVQAAIIGTVTPPDKSGPFAQRGVLRVFEQAGGSPIAEIPAALLASEAPKYLRAMKEPSDWEERRKTPVTPPKDWVAAIRTFVDDAIPTPQEIYRRYDHMLFLNTIIPPGSDSSLLAVAAPGLGRSSSAVALSVDGNPHWCAADPYWGSVALVAECALNVATSGAQPLALVDCLNFGNPTHPEVMWQLSRSIDGIARAATELSLPVVGGNVSLYNASAGKDIDPTPTVCVLGLRPLPDSTPPQLGLSKGAVVLVTTAESPSLTGSLFARRVCNDEGGVFPTLDFDKLRSLLEFVTDTVVHEPGIASVHNVARGGLVVALRTMAGTSRLIWDMEDFSMEELVGEHPSRVLVACHDPERTMARANDFGLSASLVATIVPA